MAGDLDEQYGPGANQASIEKNRTEGRRVKVEVYKAALSGDATEKQMGYPYDDDNIC